MSLNRWYERLWYHQHPLHYFLIPFAWLYQFTMAVRRVCYQVGLFRVTTLPVPVIVVGNLTVGGTGKTPCVLAIASWLQQQGERPGILSRGYKSKAKQYPARVTGDSNATEMGDEPVLLAKRSGCPVYIDPNRVRGAKALLAQTDCSIILSDDGMQHYALGRDLEILVLDGERRLGNGYCLPAGPLRESKTRANTVHYTVATGKAEINEFCQTYQMGELINIKNPANRVAFADMHNVVHAVAGIGNPGAFFTQLEAKGLTVIPHIFPDHAQYTSHDLCFYDKLPVVMTEKDAVKCQEFAEDDWFYVPIVAILSESFFKILSRFALHEKEYQLS